MCPIRKMSGGILEACVATYTPFKNLSKGHTKNKFCVYFLFQQIFWQRMVRKATTGKYEKNVRNYPANKKYLK